MMRRSAHAARLGNGIGVGFGLLAAIALGLSGCANGTEEQSGLPMEDDFSGECSWSDTDDEQIRLACEGGEYSVLYRRVDEQVHHMMRQPVEEPVTSLSVEADARLEAFPGGSSEDLQAHGVGCWATPVGEPGQGYLFIVLPSLGAFAIFLQDEELAPEESPLVPLVDEESDAVPPPGEMTQIRAECKATDDGVDLTMFLDGEEVGSASVPGEIGAAGFQAVGFSTFSTKADTEIRFDNFRAEELGD